MAAKPLQNVLRRSIAGPQTDFLQFLDGFSMQPQDIVIRNQSRGTDPRTFYRSLEQDDRVFAVLQKRYTNVLNGTLVVEPGRRRGMSATRVDRKAADMVKDQLRNMGTNSNDLLEGSAAKAHFATGFTNFTLGMLDALLMGYAVGEIMWNVDGSEIVAEEIRMRDQRRFSFVKKEDEFQLHLHQKSGKFELLPLPARKFITYTWGSNDDPYGLGLGHRLYWPVFFKRRGMSYWLKFLEKHGIPTVLAKTDSADPVVRNNLFNAAKALQSESVVVIKNDEMIELIEATRGAIQTGGYEALNDAMNKTITITIVGSELSTDIKDGGSRAATTVHSQEEKNLAIKDGDELQEGPYQRLSKWITYHNFAEDVATPIIFRRYPLQENLDEEVRILKVLSEIGFEANTEAGIKYVNDTFGKGSDEPIFQYTGKKDSPSQGPSEQEENERDREGEENFQDEQEGKDQ